MAKDDRLNGARNLGTLNGIRAFQDSVGLKDRNDYYTFSLSRRSSFNLLLNKLQSNVDVSLIQDGKVLFSSKRRGEKPETIATNLRAGTYYLRIHPKGDRSKYRLKLNATPSPVTGISLFNTGVNSNSAQLTAGTLDPHWQLVAGPNITAPIPAVVLNNQHPFSQYFETTNSKWIWVNAGGNISPGGPYTFRLHFDLSGLDPKTAQIAGFWGVDDTGGTIKLNGATPTGTGLSLLPTLFDNFNILHSFTITSGFVEGINSLEITVTDVSNPGGLNVTTLNGFASPL